MRCFDVSVCWSEQTAVQTIEISLKTYVCGYLEYGVDSVALAVSLCFMRAWRRIPNMDVFIMLKFNHEHFSEIHIMTLISNRKHLNVSCSCYLPYFFIVVYFEYLCQIEYIMNYVDPYYIVTTVCTEYSSKETTK